MHIVTTENSVNRDYALFVRFGLRQRLVDGQGAQEDCDEHPKAMGQLSTNHKYSLHDDDSSDEETELKTTSSGRLQRRSVVPIRLGAVRWKYLRVHGWL